MSINCIHGTLTILKVLVPGLLVILYRDKEQGLVLSETSFAEITKVRVWGLRQITCRGFKAMNWPPFLFKQKKRTCFYS